VAHPPAAAVVASELQGSVSMPKKNSRTKTPARPITVPQSREEADLFIRQVGELQRQRTKLEADMNEALANTKHLYEVRNKDLKDEIEARAKGLETWAAAHRSELTRDGRQKTARFAAGEVSWRNRPARVTLRNIKDLIPRIVGLGLADLFIRTKYEINKEAMLANPEMASSIEGVSIGSGGEDFVVKPFETELEEVA
jgi:phage host-nuclease inhibitor protein Gam